jgi:hypothetical protein
MRRRSSCVATATGQDLTSLMDQLDDLFASPPSTG